jgi:adenylyl-sulfate kinase
MTELQNGAHEASAKPTVSRGAVVWFTGLSGSGKSTLATALAPRLRAAGKKVELLDGDVVRTHLSKGLGFSREDRDLNIARIAFVAELLSRNGVFVVVAAISPYRAAREAARQTIGDFVEVHVAPPLEACVQRDTKGLYARALAGQIPQFTGVSDPYEPPASAEVTLDTTTTSVDSCVDRVIAALVERGYVEPRHAAAPNLPRFSDPKDIDTFVEKLEAFEKGELTSDQFRAFRLLRGVYGQRQEGTQMIRVKIPFGQVGPEQLGALADIADRYSRGFGHVTTRQNVQFHFVAMKDAEAAMRRLDEAGLTTREACGNSVRNVTACELAEVCTNAPFDVTPYAEALVRHFLRHPLSSSLPRKFKIAFSGCAHDCAKGAIHDIGFIAKAEDGQRGFKVVAAGGLSTTPEAALTLHDFVPAAELGRVGEALVRLFHALGNRENKARARMKYVLRKLGEQGFRDAYAQRRAEVDAEAMAELRLPDSPANPPAPPLAGDARAPGFLAWRASCVVGTKKDGFAAVYVRLFLGDVTSAQLRALGQVARSFGDGTVRLTIDQNVLIPWVHEASLPALFAALSTAGLARLDIHTARDVTSCPGAETCNLAVTASRQVANAISERLEAHDVHGLAALADTVIKVSGCPNSCGQHHIADLGFHGGAKKIGTVTYPVYQLHLGGGVDERGARFGRQVVKIYARRVPDAVVALMRLFEAERTEGEKVAAFFQRVDPKRVTAALAELLGPPTAEDALDIGQDTGFLLQTGQGECAA